MHSVGHLSQPSSKLVTALCRLKLINVNHVDQKFLFNTFIVAELQIKIFILQSVIELAVV